VNNTDAPKPRLRRRAAALAVLVVSLGALIATTPAQYEARLEEAIPLQANLTAVTPRATVEVELTVTREAFSLTRPPRIATVEFRIEDQDAGHRYALDVEPIGVDALPAGEGRAVAFDLERLCAAGIACTRGFAVTVEWLNPGVEASPRVVGELVIVYASDENEAVPTGADAAWTALAGFKAVPIGASVDAATEDEAIVLDADRPAALRHVTLAGSASALTGETLAFLDLTMAQGSATDVEASLIPDSTGGRLSPGATLADVFADCPPEARCEAGVTVLFQLMPGDANTTATLNWRMRAVAAFEGVEVPPQDAKLTAVVDRAVDVSVAGPALVASAEGELGPAQSQWLRVTANAEALPEAAFGGLSPLAIGTLTVEGGAGGNVVASVGLERPVVAPRVGAETAALVLFPLADCSYGEECMADLRVHTEGSPPEADLDGVPIAWHLEVRLVYPLLDAVPAAAELDVDVLEPSS
jgi:hypothetical protein